MRKNKSQMKKKNKNKNYITVVKSTRNNNETNLDNKLGPKKRNKNKNNQIAIKEEYKSTQQYHESYDRQTNKKSRLGEGIHNHLHIIKRRAVGHPTHFWLLDYLSESYS